VYTNASGTSYQLSTLQSPRIVPPSISATESLYQYQSVNGTAYEVKAGGTYYSATYDPVSGVATVDVSTATSAVPSFATGAAKVADGYTQVKVALATATTAAGYDLSKVNQALSANSANSLVRDTKTGSYYIKSVLNGQTSYYQAAMGTSTTGGTIHVISAMTNQVVVDPLASIDKAIAQVDNLRSGLGAMQNRFQSAIDNLSNTQTNLEASRSRIQDANYATEVSNMTKAQILQQAGTAVLAQANQVPQSILSLLR
jgi:flagellin